MLIECFQSNQNNKENDTNFVIFLWYSLPFVLLIVFMSVQSSDVSENVRIFPVHGTGILQ